MADIISRDPNVLGGPPVFVDTRVPLESLVDYLKHGRSIDYFLEHFPIVTREQVEQLLDEAKVKALPQHVTA